MQLKPPVERIFRQSCTTMTVGLSRGCVQVSSILWLARWEFLGELKGLRYKSIREIALAEQWSNVLPLVAQSCLPGIMTTILSMQGWLTIFNVSSSTRSSKQHIEHEKLVRQLLDAVLLWSKSFEAMSDVAICHEWWYLLECDLNSVPIAVCHATKR